MWSFWKKNDNLRQNEVSRKINEETGICKKECSKQFEIKKRMKVYKTGTNKFK